MPALLLLHIYSLLFGLHLMFHILWHYWSTDERIKNFQEEFWDQSAHKPKTKHRHTSAHTVYYVLCLLSVTTISGLQVPKSTVCLSYLNIPRLNENCILSFWEGKLGPYHSLQTQHGAVIRFVSTFCSWWLISVTSSTLEKKIYSINSFSLCLGKDFWGQILPGFIEKRSDVTEA